MSQFKNLLQIKKESEKKYYCEVEFLQATGTQYINTGIYANNNTKIELIFNQRGAQLTGWFFGGEEGATSTAFHLYTQTSGGLHLDAGFGTNAGISQLYMHELNTWYKLVLGIEGAYIYGDDGALLNDLSVPQGSFQSETECTLFRLNRPSVQYNGCCKIRACKFWESGRLVRDYIPVLDWNLVPCFYDKVNGTLVYNAGTGTFLYGREIHYVDYIQSTFTQYVDTGLSHTDLTLEYTARCSDVSVVRSQIFLAVTESTSWVGWKDGATNPSTSSSIDISQFRDYRCVYNSSQIILTDIGTGTSGTIANGGFENTLRLFGFGGGIFESYSALKKMKIWQGSTLVRDYLPAVDENGVAFLFDGVDRKIYDNAGTGAFEYPELNLLSLSSTGTQWLDTGVVANNTMCIQFDAGYDSINTAYNRLAGTQIGLARTITVRSSTISGGKYYAEGNTLDETVTTFASSFNVDLLKHRLVFNDYSVFKIDNELMSSIKKIPDNLTTAFALFCNMSSSGTPMDISNSRFYAFSILENTLASGYREVEYIQVNNGTSEGLRNRIEVNTTWADIDEIDFTVATRSTGYNMLVCGKTSDPMFSGSQPYVTLGNNTLSFIKRGFDEAPTIVPSSIADRQGTFTTVAITGISVSGDTANSHICFGVWGDSSYSKTNQFKEIILKKNDVIVADLKPCIRVSDSVAGMYDVTNSVFYPNGESDKLNMITAGPLKYMMNLKPVLTNGVGRFYDEVSGTYKSNSGTGNFVLGKIEEDGRFPNV